jgi:hypothetical protein
MLLFYIAEDIPCKAVRSLDKIIPIEYPCHIPRAPWGIVGSKAIKHRRIGTGAVTFTLRSRATASAGQESKLRLCLRAKGWPVAPGKALIAYQTTAADEAKTAL